MENGTTYQEFKKVAIEKMSTLTTNDLIESVKKLSNDFTESATRVFEIALEILMERMPEQEFINLCDSL
jgi:hypothetical protein